ncbi:MAG: PA domain-containing protein [Thermoanaerobaculia bacterium]
MLLFAVLFVVSNVSAGPGRLLIINTDSADVGFNDPTPVEPIGGNDGTTLGQQRHNVYLKAAETWQNALEVNVDIRVRSGFAALLCNESGAVLAQTSVVSWSANFPGAPRTDVWYPAALANQLARTDIEPTRDDMVILSNSSIDRPDCMGDRSWYYGYDGNAGMEQSLYHVALHEIGHGLGIASRATTEFFLNRPSVFDLHTLDTTIGLRWDQMTSQQRDVSYSNTGNLVWAGEHVTRMAPGYLQQAPIFTVTQPSAIASNYDIGTATFGPPANLASMSGRVVAATDTANAEGPSTTDGCTALSNADAISGNIALIDRGTCTFVAKARNAQNAGAIGVIVADNRKETCLPPAMGSNSDHADITIPVVSVTQDQGDSFDAQLAQNAEVRGMLRVDPSRLAGASALGHVRLYAPCTAEPGSSKHHWDVPCSPNLLMEPAINSDLPNGLDLALYQLMDMGWTLSRTGRRFFRR